ncbi:MAG: zf-HC2 domain-containing protein [Desulfobacteraceae bacterium]|jgi:hypothetical protein
MDCEEIRERLSAYVDDDLDRASKAVVEEHLASCKACQQEVASLKALVRELGALESVEPPKDFLNQLNERIEARSWFPKILRTLFKPMRVKIPLEFAGVVAVAILVFIVLHTQKEELGLKKAPVGPARQERPSEQVVVARGQAEAPGRSKEERVHEKGVEAFGEGMKEESYTEPQLASRPEEEKMAKKYAADTLKQAVKDQAPPPERESIELALVMKKEIPPESLAPGAAMEAAPAPKKKMRRSLALPQTVPSGKPDRDEEQDDSLSRLRKLIELVGGEVVSVEYNEQTNTPASIGAWIPADQVYTFYNKLKELGDLRTPPEAVTGKGHEVLSVSIRLLSSE